tara:strand:+ start:311 stop:910 length:600 start_codon:yes stop_codon:yes gene_type:complete
MRFRSIAHSFDILSNHINKIIGKYNIIVLVLRGIEIGPGSIFLGKSIFRKFPNSKIIIGKNVKMFSKAGSNLIGINRPCSISTLAEGASIKIGNNCGFSGTVLGSFKEIIIDDDVKCGANTLITDSDWHDEDYRCGINKKVHIKKNVWLGEGVKVLKGVTIGENSLIGAGSIVVNSIPDNVVAAGNPCKVIKKLIDGKI